MLTVVVGYYEIVIAHGDTTIVTAVCSFADLVFAKSYTTTVITYVISVLVFVDAGGVSAFVTSVILGGTIKAGSQIFITTTVITGVITVTIRVCMIAHYFAAAIVTIVIVVCVFVGNYIEGFFVNMGGIVLASVNVYSGCGASGGDH